MAVPVLVRQLLEFVEAPLKVGKKHHGEVCTDEWVQHYVQIDFNFVNGSSSHSTAHHERQTRTVTPSTDTDVDYADVNLRISIVKNQGDFI
eukprot:3400281-Prymnesium_polylepis.2